MTAYVDLLGSFVPDFYWFRNAHWVTGGEAGILGTVLLGPGIEREEMQVLLDQKPVEFEVRSSPYGEDKFWFLPESRRFDVFIRSREVAGDQPFTIAMKVGDRADAKIGHTFVQFPDWKKIEPTPPVPAIERVSGKGATDYNYHNNGLTDAWRFSRIAARHGLLVGDADVLDWGCGCGRLSRHLMRSAKSVRGIDIDAENIEWCKNNIDINAFDVVNLYPPTPYASNVFDLVIANSVLSHLTLDAMEQWLVEMHRLLKPGGIALLSYHGQFSLAGFCSKSEPMVRKVLASGFNADTRAAEVNDVIGDPEYYRHTFMTDEFAEELFSKYFIPEERVVGVVSRFQNVAVLRKA